MLFVPNESVFQIAITNHFCFSHLNRVFHTHLENFNYLNDLHEIKFKNVIKNLLTLVKQFKLKSICIPLKYWIDVGYPRHLLFNLINDALNNYIKTNQDHQLTKISIHIEDCEIDLINSFKEKYSFKSIENNLSLNNDYKLECLNPNLDEYKVISNQFKSSLPNVIITKIEKIKNPFLTQMYSKLKEAVKLNHLSTLPLEWKLFHGTDLDTVYKICESGFNRSYAGKNGSVYGRGVYFARDSQISHKYSNLRRYFDKKTLKESIVLLSSVIVGQYELGNTLMIDTNRRPDGKKYDSTVNDLAFPTIFVVYKDYQAIPEYIIHYTF